MTSSLQDTLIAVCVLVGMAVVALLIFMAIRSSEHTNKQNQITRRTRIEACAKFEDPKDRIICLDRLDR